jgi:translocation protein SEC66
MDNNTNSSSNSTYEGWQSQQPPKSFWTNLTLPVLYLTILIGSLYAFSTLYRKRQQSKAANLEPWFPQHRQRDIYLSLLHLDPAEASDSGESEKKLSKVPDSVLKAALLRRALEDIKRIVQLRNGKPALQTLLQRGSVGDELWQRFLRAEKEMEEEVKDVVNEVSQSFSVRLWRVANAQSLGERIRAKLGSNYLPVCKRDQPEHPTQRAHRRDSIAIRG